MWILRQPAGKAADQVPFPATSYRAHCTYRFGTAFTETKNAMTQLNHQTAMDFKCHLKISSSLAGRLWNTGSSDNAYCLVFTDSRMPHLDT